MDAYYQGEATTGAGPISHVSFLLTLHIWVIAITLVGCAVITVCRRGE